MTMTGTAIGMTGAAARFTTTTMFTCPIRPSHHAATILRIGLQAVRARALDPEESAASAVSVDREALAVSVVSGVQAESAVPAESADQGELAVSAV